MDPLQHKGGVPLQRLAESSLSLKTLVRILSLLLLCCKPAAFVRTGEEAGEGSDASDAASIGGGIEGAGSLSQSELDADLIRAEEEVNEAIRTTASVTANGDANFSGGVEAGAGSTIHETTQSGDTSKTMGALNATGTANISEGVEVGTGGVSREAAHTGRKEGAHVGDSATTSRKFAGAAKHQDASREHLLAIPSDSKCATSGHQAHIGCSFPGCTCEWNRSCDMEVSVGICVIANWFWILVAFLILGAMGVVTFGASYIKEKCLNLAEGTQS